MFERLAAGEEVTLPNLMETLHRVHADEVAQAFECALHGWNAVVGESFHVISPKALTLRGYAEAVAGWFGEETNLEYLGWAEWQETVSEEDAQATEDHVRHSPNCSVAKTRRELGYEPRYTSERTLREAVEWMVEEGEIVVSA